MIWPSDGYPPTAFGLDDPQAAPPQCYCELCGEGIYEEPFHIGGFWSGVDVCQTCYNLYHDKEDVS